MKYEVCIEGSFVHEIIVEAKNPKEAEKLGIAEFDKVTGLQREDYSITSATVIPEEQNDNNS